MRQKIISICESHAVFEINMLSLVTPYFVCPFLSFIFIMIPGEMGHMYSSEQLGDDLSGYRSK